MPTGAKSIVFFFLLACAFSWFGLLGNWLVPSQWWPLPMNPFGPLMAVPVVLTLSGGWSAVRAWLRRIARLRAPIRIYAAATLIPLAIILVSVGLAVSAGTAHGRLPQLGPIEFVILVPILLLLGPAPEEVSFRGYAQHDLQQRLPVLATALWIGLGVAIWHLPLLLLGDLPAVLLLTLPAVSVVYAWLYVAGGSVWPLVALHLIQNYAGGEYFGQMFAPQDDGIWLGFLTIFYVAWASMLAAWLGPDLGWRRERVSPVPSPGPTASRR